MISISNRRIGLILLIFVVLGFLIYSNTFDASFHYDDAHVVSDLSFKDMLEKCKGGGSRVICHLTFLFNYWLSGANVLGYHIFNTLIHIGTAYFVYVFLFQVLSASNPKTYTSSRHTDSILPPLSDPIFWPAFLGGIFFLVHPLATQAVTYITQRYASLAGFFYIGSLAFFVSAHIKFVVSPPRRAGRLPGKEDGHSDIAPLDPALPGVASGKRAGKQNERFLSGSHLVPYLCSIVMAVLAMRTKEMAVTLPVAMLLTEYYFIQSDFKAAKKRILYLLPLLSTGLIIPVSDIIGVENINLESVAALQDYTWDAGTGITRTEYLFTQFKIILGIYLKLMVWPIGQNIDHDYVISKTLFDLPTLASFLVLCIILAGSLWLFKRSKLISFSILWFFVTISPTSSIVPNTEFVAEHRVYISLMGLAFAIAGLLSWQTHWKRYLSVLLPVLLLLSGLTYARNRVWKTDLTLWEDSVAKSEERARPHNNLGIALAERGMLNDATSHFQEALQIKPNYPDAHNNLGIILTKQGRLKKAISHYSESIRFDPNHFKAHNNLGLALLNQGKPKEAIGHFQQALRINPQFAGAHNNLGIALAGEGRLKEAIRYYSEALRFDSDYAKAHSNLGNALLRLGRIKEAVKHYSEALRINPNYSEVHYKLGFALYRQGEFEKAIFHYSKALRITPNLAEVHYYMGIALAKQGRLKEAISHFSKTLSIQPDHTNAIINLGSALAKQGKLKEAARYYTEALRIKPDYAEAHYNLAVTLVEQGRLNEAIRHYTEAVRIKPGYAEAHSNLGVALAAQGRLNEAIRHYSEALRINPDYAEAHYNLGNALTKQGRLKEAIAHYSEALRIKPDYAEAHKNLKIVTQMMSKSTGVSECID